MRKADGYDMHDQHLKTELVYQLRKSLLPLNRALIMASNNADFKSIQEIKKCLTIIKKQIIILSVK